MKKQSIIALTIISLMIIFIPPAIAWDDCPYGLVDDTYPGECRRYTDTNDNGICDHSESAPEEKSSTVPVVTGIPEGTTVALQSSDPDVSSSYFVTSYMTLSDVAEMYDIATECLFSHIKSRFNYSADITGEETVKEITQVAGFSIEELQSLAQQMKDGDEVNLMADFEGEEYPFSDKVGVEESISTTEEDKKSIAIFIALSSPIIFMSGYAFIRDILKKSKDEN